ncbi:MAG: ABC transporter ATP-binding protein [Alphaproteobacteria bacterium]|nr:ABC transporter ATP-binding protein [Alphaproteobacteria bacterium]
MIEVEGLTFDYPTVRALDDVSFRVEAGAIAALVGPNGAGKTTLLRCLAALDTPFAGRMRLDGIDVTRHPRAVHARIGYLPDFFGLYDELTVRQCLVYAARSRGRAPAEAEAAARRTAGLVDLDARFEAAAETLSRGLRQRLAIGQAIVHRPKVLLLDEPASGLDPQARRRLSALFLALRSEGMTLIVSSHILAELEDYCTEMLVIEGGRLMGGRAIRVGEEAGETVRLRIGLAAADGRFVELLGAAGALEILRRTDTEADVVAPADPAVRAGLLARLVEAGLLVCEFAVMRRRLEDAYFAEVPAVGAGPGEGRPA